MAATPPLWIPGLRPRMTGWGGTIADISPAEAEGPTPVISRRQAGIQWNEGNTARPLDSRASSRMTARGRRKPHAATLADVYMPKAVDFVPLDSRASSRMTARGAVSHLTERGRTNKFKALQ